MKQRFYLLVMVAVMVAVGSVQMAAADEWEKVLTAAKKEGTVMVVGPAGSNRSDSLTVKFQKKYPDIKVEYWAARGSEIVPKLRAERTAGKFLWDVYVGGTTSALTAMIPGGMLDAVELALILPEVTDSKQWRGGGIEFVDPGKHLVIMTPSQFGTLFVNPNAVKPDSIRSHKDLLDPKFKGKISMDDPTKAGPGMAAFTFFYLHPALGPSFIRELAKQEPIAQTDYMQEVDGIAKNKFLVLIGTSDVIAEERMKAGVPIAIVNPRNLKESTGLSPSSGSLGMFNRAPHPNAAKVYINWLLSKEGQAEFAHETGYISARLDVSTAHSPWRVPIPGSIKTYTQEAMDVGRNLIPLIQEAYGLKARPSR